MDTNSFVLWVFGAIVLLALLFDLGIMSKKDQEITVKKALIQTFFWVSLALAFFVFLWFEYGQKTSLEYLSAYLMEWSLSIDNIFVFILIFSAFGIKKGYAGRVLLIGIILAIVFRILFITVGVALVEKFHWILYLFGAFLLFTGYKMFIAKEDEQFNPIDSKVYKILSKILPMTTSDGNGKFSIIENGKKYFTTLFMTVVMLAFIDIVFALDSIPAVMGLVDTSKGNEYQARLVIYTSNIFAVLGLRSLFFLLKGAVDKFDFFQQGIAIVLMFIGVKMLGEYWLNQYLDKSTQVFFSLVFIMFCISGSIFYSLFIDKKKSKKLYKKEIDKF